MRLLVKLLPFLLLPLIYFSTSQNLSVLSFNSFVNSFNGESFLIESELKEYSFVAVGDVSFSRAVERAVKNRNNWFYPFEHVQDVIKSADIAFANLETTVMEGRSIRDNEMVFRSDPFAADVLSSVGFDIVSLANNHTPDFRLRGVQDTIANLDRVGILHSGLGESLNQALDPVVFDLDGLKISVISFLDPAFVPNYYGASDDGFGALFMTEDNLVESITRAKSVSDLVFVSMHAGQEYVNNPNQFQVEFARKAIDLGAEMVIGHHPHVVQSMEKYKGKYIFYSLGNFVFDQPFSFNTKAGVMLDFTFTNQGVKKIILRPYFMHNFVQPNFAYGDLSSKILDQLNYKIDNDPLLIYVD